jgi:hypothetical protein
VNTCRSATEKFQEFGVENLGVGDVEPVGSVGDQDESAMNEDHGGSKAMVFVVDLDVGGVLLANGHIRHGVTP